jgi:hypothetical protein
MLGNSKKRKKLTESGKPSLASQKLILPIPAWIAGIIDNVVFLTIGFK